MSQKKPIADSVHPATRDLMELKAMYGMSLRRMAALVNWDHRNITAWRSGRINPPLGRLNQFAGIFGYEARLLPRYGAHGITKAASAGDRDARGRKSSQPSARVPAVIRDLMELQREYNISDAALGALAGWSPSVLYAWRCGRSKPTLKALSDFAAVFGREVRLKPKPMAERAVG